MAGKRDLIFLMEYKAGRAENRTDTRHRFPRAIHTNHSHSQSIACLLFVNRNSRLASAEFLISTTSQRAGMNASILSYEIALRCQSKALTCHFKNPAKYPSLLLNVLGGGTFKVQAPPVMRRFTFA